MGEKKQLCGFCHQAMPALSDVTSTIVLADVEMWDECENLSPIDRMSVCAREPGHPGDHVACGLQFHGVARWPRERKPAAEEEQQDE